MFNHIQEIGLEVNKWPEGVRCPSVVECQGGKAGVWVRKYPHSGRGTGARVGWGISEGETWKGESI